MNKNTSENERIAHTRAGREALKADWMLEGSAIEVRDAVYNLLHNPQTPADLWEAIADWAGEQANRMTTEILHSETAIEMILNSISPDELQGAVIAARETKGGDNGTL